MTRDINQCVGLTEDADNITTVIVPFLYVISGDIYIVMSCGSEGVIRHPRSVFPILVVSATCIPVRKNSCRLSN
jgi:hypothetical protein